METKAARGRTAAFWVWSLVPQTPHIERHFASSEAVRDIVIGMSDGLTVPFALAAGLSGRLESSSLIVVAGLAEIVAGAIAMGLGGYLAASSDTEHYVTERAREEREVRDIPNAEAAELTTVLTSYGLSAEESAPIVTALRKRPEAWVDFMMRFELGIERPNPRRAVRSALTIAGAYVAGGLIPLAPYIEIGRARIALALSVIVTSAALTALGYVKGHFTGTPPLHSALYTALIGGLAAAAAFLVARAIV
jgi:vacuolar iron transporter family protein